MKYCFFVSVFDSCIRIGPYNNVLEQEKNNEVDKFRFVFVVNPSNKEMIDEIKAQKETRFEIFENKQNETEDKIIKELLLSCSADQTIIIKEGYPIKDFSSLNSIMIAGLKKHDIVTVVSAKHTKKITFLQKMKKFFSKITNFIFGFNLYEGDHRFMLISKKVLETMKLFPAKITRFTKVNCFVGFNEATIEDMYCTKVNYKIPKYKIVPLVLFWTCFVVLLSGHILLSSLIARLNTAVFHSLFTMADIISLILSIYYSISAKLSCEVGEFVGDEQLKLREMKIEKRN